MKSVFTLVAIAGLAASAEAEFIVAEHTSPPNATGGFNCGAGIASDGAVFDNRQAQTFIPTTAGLLQDISFNVSRMTGTNADLRVSVTDVIGGQPGDTLESVLLPFSDVGTDWLDSRSFRNGEFSHTVTTSGSLMLEAGVTYALVFSSDTPEANYRLYGDYSEYAEGVNLWFQNSGPYTESHFDLLFRITATPVPEPQTTLMIGLGAICFWRRRAS